MNHKFGDLLQEYLQAKKLTQKDMAKAINVDPALVSRMVGGYLSFQRARETVVKMLVWLHEQQAINHLDEANALLEAAGMEGLSADQKREAELLSSLSRLQSSMVSTRDAKRHPYIEEVSAPDQTPNEPTRSPMPTVRPSAPQRVSLDKRR